MLISHAKRIESPNADDGAGECGCTGAPVGEGRRNTEDGGGDGKGVLGADAGFE
jgi:hypothetical protein